MRVEDLPDAGFTGGEMTLIEEAVRRARRHRSNVGAARDAVADIALTRVTAPLHTGGTWQLGTEDLTVQSDHRHCEERSDEATQPTGAV